MRRIKLLAPAADTLVVGLARALKQDEDMFRDEVVSWYDNNRNAAISLVMSDKVVEQNLADIWASEYGDGCTELDSLQRDGRTTAKVVSGYYQWAGLMRKVGTYTDFLFLCVVAAMFRVTLACGDLDEGADPDGPGLEDYFIVPDRAQGKIYLFFSPHDSGWYLGDESKECSEEEVRYVRNLGYFREVIQGESHQEAVYVHLVGKRKATHQGFFAALAGALNHEAGHGPPGALKHTGHSVRDAVRSHCERNMEPIEKDFNQIYKVRKGCIWKIGSHEVGYVPGTSQEWLNWNFSGKYEVDGLMIGAAAECFQAQVIVVNPECKCARAVI